MRILVCVKRVPMTGGTIVLTDDAQAIETRHLGFTISPHEECGVEEAVRLVDAHGGESVVLTLGPAEAEEQLRDAMAIGVDRAIHLVTDNAEVDAMASAWVERGFEIPLVMVEAPFRDLGAPLLEEIRNHTARGDTIVTVVLPEVVPTRWWQNLLHGQTALYFKRLLLFEPHVVVTSVPLHLRSPEQAEDPAAALLRR